MKIKLKTIKELTSQIQNKCWIFNQLWDNFDFFPIQNERIALMVGGIAHPMLGRLAHLLYELEIHDKLGGLREF